MIHTQIPKGAYLDEGKAEEVCRWIERCCIHTKGKWRGMPFALLPWQQMFLLRLFGTLSKDTGRRMYRTALLEIPKKNGKSELGAAIALYMLIGDEEPAPEIVAASATDDNADDTIFAAIRIMCTDERSRLKGVVEPWKDTMLVPSIPGAKLSRVPTTAGANDGPNLHCVVADELHQWTSPKTVDAHVVLANGSIARDQPLFLQVSTPGVDPETVLGQEHDRGLKLVSGEIEDPAYYFEWWSAPEGSKLDDRKAWEAANPSHGITITWEAYQAQRAKMHDNDVKRYFLGVWTEHYESWLPENSWEQCKSELELEEAA